MLELKYKNVNYYKNNNTPELKRPYLTHNHGKKQVNLKH